MKRCNKCGREQNDSEFQKRHPSRCLSCWKLYDCERHKRLVQELGREHFRKLYGKIHKKQLRKYGRKGLNEKAMSNYHKRKAKIFERYGGRYCAHCGTQDTRVLVLDHINNDGNQHRLKVLGAKDRAGTWTYNWIIKNNYPPGFQVLCHNCNWIKRLNARTLPMRDIDIYRNDLEYNALKYAKEA